MPRYRPLIEDDELNMTPMIDIVFLLIIFFMVGTKFTELERKIGLKVPEISENGALTAAPEKKVVNVYRDGHLTLDRDIVTLAELTQPQGTALDSARRQLKSAGKVAIIAAIVIWLLAYSG